MPAKPVKTVLIISSQTASSAIGAGASAYCLNALGIETIILPTTLFGRHPGWGAPGGGAISAPHIASMWDAIAKQNITFDAVLTGYMASIEQTELARRIINELKALNPDMLTLVDPVMGDKGSLYVSPDIANAMIEQLVPIADFITPNMWEFSFITKKLPQTLQKNAKDIAAEDIITAAQTIKASIIVTSVRSASNIGAMLVHGAQAYLVSHAQREIVPHGGGDALSGLALGHLLSGHAPKDAMARSVASIFEIFRAYDAKTDRGELPLIRLNAHIANAAPLKLQNLSPLQSDDS